MFDDFKCSTLNIQVSDYLNLMENSIFQLSVFEFHSVKSRLTKRVLRCKWGTLLASLHKNIMGRMLDICPEPRLKSCLLNVNVAAAKWVSNRKIISSEEKNN